MTDSLGQRIKLHRNEKGMTQHALALQVGVSKRTIIFWEQGKDVPSSSRIPTLAKVLGVDSNYLLTGKRLARYLDLVVPNPVITAKQQQDDEKQVIETRVKFNELKIVPLPEFAELKVIEPKASADFNPVFAPQISTVWVDKKLVTDKHYGVCIKGQSMAPTICEGDVAIVQRQGWLLEEYDSDRGAALKHEWKKLHRCVVICSINDEEPLCKRLFVTDLPNSEVGFFIQLGSDNSEAPPIAIWRKDRLVVYGVVVASVRDMRPNGHC